MQQPRFSRVALRLRLVSVPAAIFLALAIAAMAQIPNLTDSTSTPLPAAGHDYLGAKLPSDARVFGGAPAEYVNPGSGSLSWRICATLPRGRQLSLPFCFTYDSEGVHHLESNGAGNLGWNSNTS